MNIRRIEPPSCDGFTFGCEQGIKRVQDSDILSFLSPSPFLSPHHLVGHLWCLGSGGRRRCRRGYWRHNRRIGSDYFCEILSGLRGFLLSSFFFFFFLLILLSSSFFFFFFLLHLLLLSSLFFLQKSPFFRCWDQIGVMGSVQYPLPPSPGFRKSRD